MLETNKDRLLKVAVQGEIVSPGSSGYRTQWDGRPKMMIGTAGIKYNLQMGDPCFGWASGDHVEPGVTIRGKEKPVPGECALALLACIGNEATVISGEAKGEKGVYTGRHAGADDLVWFPAETIEKLAIGDKVQIKAYGVGLKIEGFEDVRVNKSSPRLLESLGIATHLPKRFGENRVALPCHPIHPERQVLRFRHRPLPRAVLLRVRLVQLLDEKPVVIRRDPSRLHRVTQRFHRNCLDVIGHEPVHDRAAPRRFGPKIHQRVVHG